MLILYNNNKKKVINLVKNSKVNKVLVLVNDNNPIIIRSYVSCTYILF